MKKEFLLLSFNIMSENEISMVLYGDIWLLKMTLNLSNVMTQWNDYHIE